MKGKSLSHVQLFTTQWTAAYQVPPSMGFSRQEYWSGLPLPSPSCWHICIYFWNFALFFLYFVNLVYASFSFFLYFFWINKILKLWTFPLAFMHYNSFLLSGVRLQNKNYQNFSSAFKWLTFFVFFFLSLSLMQLCNLANVLRWKLLVCQAQFSPALFFHWILGLSSLQFCLFIPTRMKDFVDFPVS